MEMNDKMFEEIQQEMMSKLPRNLVTLLMLNYDYTTIREIIDSPKNRMEDELYDDYRVRLWLQDNITRYRFRLPNYMIEFNKIKQYKTKKIKNA
jgi:hypothetical protein